MKVISNSIYFDNRQKLAEEFPFTLKISDNQEQHILICKSLRIAVQYCVEFIKSAPIHFLNEYSYIKKIDMSIFRTDGDYNLIKDFTPQRLNWNISGRNISLTFKDMRMTDGVRLKAYVNQLKGLKVQ